MASVVDASIWVDCLRKESPETLRRLTSAIIMADDSFLCEPVIFELLRAIPKRDLTRTETLMATLPVLPTPSDPGTLREPSDGNVQTMVSCLLRWIC
jgi:predicted nucleic acid-binding protein